jgi:hypothetical protein
MPVAHRVLLVADMRIVQVIMSVFLTFPLLGSAAHAADIAFFPVESATLAPDDALAIGELLAQSYASASGQAVLAPSRITVDGRPPATIASSLGVTEYVRTDAVRVGDRIVLHSVRYQSDGTAIYQVKLVAEQIEDMIAVSERIAKALFHRVDDELVRTRHNVTLGEARPESRRWVEKITGFKTGVHVPFAKGAEFSASISLNFNMRLEMDRYFLEYGAGIIVPTKTQDYGYESMCDDQGCVDAVPNEGRIGGLAAEFSGNLFLTDDNIAPYAGIGLSPRVIFSSEDLANMCPFVQFGLMFPRDSSTRLYAHARLAQSVLAVQLDNGRDTHPTELIFEAGFGW